MIPKQYIPKPGDRVKLADWSSYSARKLTPWSWLQVLSIQEAGHCIDPIADLMVLNGDKPTEQKVSVPVGEIEKPLYWEPVYSVYVADREQGEKVLSWLREGRGVKVWGSQDLGTAGRTFYTPGDANKPHWSVAGVEIVHDPDRIKVLLVVKHPVPTGEPTGVVHADDWKKAKAEAVKERKKALREHKALGREVQNIRGPGNCVLESWFETYEEIKLEGAEG